MASGETTATMQCPECKEPIEFPVSARHLTSLKVALSYDLAPVREHIARHQAQLVTELPSPTQRGAAHTTEIVTMDQGQRTIRTDRALSETEAQALRDHVAEHGLVDLPFGATVQPPIH